LLEKPENFSFKFTLIGKKKSSIFDIFLLFNIVQETYSQLEAWTSDSKALRVPKMLVIYRCPFCMFFTFWALVDRINILVLKERLQFILVP